MASPLECQQQQHDFWTLYKSLQWQFCQIKLKRLKRTSKMEDDNTQIMDNQERPEIKMGEAQEISNDGLENSTDPIGCSEQEGSQTLSDRSSKVSSTSTMDPGNSHDNEAEENELQTENKNAEICECHIFEDCCDSEKSVDKKTSEDPDTNDEVKYDIHSKDKLSEGETRRWTFSYCPLFCFQKDSVSVMSLEEQKADYIAREKRTVLKNTCIISIAFLFVFSAFQGLTRLQSSLHRDRGMGTICQSVMYSALVASCLVLPNISIHTIGLKKTIIFSFFGYIIWFAANGYAVWGTMVTASIVMGIAAGPLWTAQSSYFTILASRYAELTGKDKSAVLSKFFGIFFAFYQFSGIVGSVITTVVLLPSERNVTSSSGDRATSCGARDCPWAESIQGHLAKPDKITVWIMLAVFLLMSLIAVFITYYFVEDLPISLDSHVKMTSTAESSDAQSDGTSQTALSDTITYVTTLESKPKEMQDGGCKNSMPPLAMHGSKMSLNEIKLYESIECVYPGDFEHVEVKQQQESSSSSGKKKFACDKESCKMIFSTLMHLRHLDQILLVPLTFYMGLEQGTSAANFTKSYIACSIGIAKIGLVYISYSAINGCASFTSGRLVKYTGRFPVLTTAFIIDLAVQSTLQLWTPDESQQYVLYILAGLWGFTDGIWHTQVTALYGAIFTGDPTAAFSCMRLLKSIGAITAFAYSSSLCTNVKVYILTSLLIVSMVGYYAVEFRQKFWKKKKVHFEEDMVVS